MTDKWLLFDVGTAEYASVLDLQHRLVRRRVAGEIANALVVAEHPHVITLGRRGEDANIIDAKGVPVVRVERGGDVTYHGPGQVVAYPVLSLDERRRDLRRYVRDLEDAIIATVDRYGIMGRHVDRKPGVWIQDRLKGERKIASVGVAVSHWVTYHGLALNVNTGLGYFQLIRPCGYSSETMTSVAEQVGQPVVTEEVKEALVEELGETLSADFDELAAGPVAGGWPAGTPAASVDAA